MKSFSSFLSFLYLNLVSHLFHCFSSTSLFVSGAKIEIREVRGALIAPCN